MKEPRRARPWRAGGGSGLRRGDGECAAPRFGTGALRYCLAAAASVLLAGAAIVAAQEKPSTAGLAVESVEVEARPIASFARDGSQVDLGKLAWRGGLVLSSRSPQFGGWSGLILADDGKSLLAISDAGTWMSGEIVYDGDRPKGLGSVRIGPTQGPSGANLTAGRDRDSEGIALAGGTLAKGTAYVSFERNARIGLYEVGPEGLGALKSFVPMPKDAKHMGNDGIEAMTRLKAGPHAGALVAFAESPLRGQKEHRGWIWIGEEAHPFTVTGVGDYGITDAAALDDGSVLILERRFRVSDGVRIRLRRLAPDGLKPDGVASGEVLLAADGASREIDNLEGLAVSRDPAGATVVTIISDDNFNHLFQRNLLLQFTLKDAAARATNAE